MSTKARIELWGGIVITMLVAANGFFVKRLVDEMDATKREVIHVQQQVAVISWRIDLAFKDASYKWPDKKKAMRSF